MGSLAAAPATPRIFESETPYNSEEISMLHNLSFMEQYEEIPENNSIQFLLPGESLDLEENQGDEYSENLCNLSSGPSLNFVSVKIGGEIFPALIDSGASRTFVSQVVRDKVVSFGFKVKKSRKVTVITPLGNEETVDENIKLPIILNTNCQKINGSRFTIHGDADYSEIRRVKDF